MQAVAKILIVDDHEMLLDGLSSILADFCEFEVVGTAKNGLEALALLRNRAIDLVLTDMNMPEMNGIQLVSAMQKEFPNVKTIVLSMLDEPHQIREAIQQGVNGYILKNTGKEELRVALQRVLQGHLFFGDAVTRLLMEQDSSNLKSDSISILTPREVEVLKLIANELNNMQIANQLNISERTVETHRKNIFRKTNTKGVVGLLKFAMEHRLI